MRCSDWGCAAVIDLEQSAAGVGDMFYERWNDPKCQV